MLEEQSLRKLKEMELRRLKERVEKRIKIKPLSKSIRKIAGLVFVIDKDSERVHGAISLISLQKMKILEEATATEEFDAKLDQAVGNCSLVPFALSLIKMLERNPDLILIKEINLKDRIPLSAFVGVIAGKPSIGIAERGWRFAGERREGMKIAGPLRVRGRKAPIGVVAGHHVRLKDAQTIVRKTTIQAGMPEPLRGAMRRLKAWLGEWQRVNIGR
ncbi:MAG: endonuclease V [bacterium]